MDEDLRNLERKALTGDSDAVLRYVFALARSGELTLPTQFPHYLMPCDVGGKIYIRPYNDTCVEVFNKRSDGPFLIETSSGFWPMYFSIEWNFMLGRGAPGRKKEWVPGTYENGQLRSNLQFFPNVENDEEPPTAVYSGGFVFNVHYSIRKWIKTHQSEMQNARALWGQLAVTRTLKEYQELLSTVAKKEQELAQLALDWVQAKSQI